MPELWDVYDAQRNRKPGSHVRGTPLAPGERFCPKCGTKAEG